MSTILLAVTMLPGVMRVLQRAPLAARGCGAPHRACGGGARVAAAARQRRPLVMAAAAGVDLAALEAEIKAAGDRVRTLKAAETKDEAAIAAAVAELLELKGRLPGAPPEKPKKGKGKQQQQQQQKKGGGGGGGGGGRQGLTPRAADYSLWYQEVIQAAELADQSPVKGCMVIRPTGMALWDALRSALDERIKESGAQNAYFPLFIPAPPPLPSERRRPGVKRRCSQTGRVSRCRSYPRRRSTSRASPRSAPS